MAISKRLRYEVLNRDNHACRYCGAYAPDAKLTIDHVVPVALGGLDDPSNLVAACADCNAGKSSSHPNAPRIADVSEDAFRWAMAMSLAADIAIGQRQARDTARNAFLSEWNSWTYPGGGNGERITFELPNDWPTTVDRLMAAGLTDDDLRDFVDQSMRIRGVRDTFRYFCGIAWRVVSERQKVAHEVIEADEARGL